MWQYIVILLVGTWITDPCSSIPENASDYYMSSSHGSDCIALHGHYNYRECRKEFIDRKEALEFIEDAPVVRDVYAFGAQYIKEIQLDSVWIDKGESVEW